MICCTKWFIFLSLMLIHIFFFYRYKVRTCIRSTFHINKLIIFKHFRKTLFLNHFVKPRKLLLFDFKMFWSMLNLIAYVYQIICLSFFEILFFKTTNINKIKFSTWIKISKTLCFIEIWLFTFLILSFSNFDIVILFLNSFR